MTDIQLRNTVNSFGWVAIIIHWVSAALVIFMFGLGLYMVDLGYYDPWYRDGLTLHKSLGVVFCAFLSARLIWRLIGLVPTGAKGGGTVEQKMAKVAHFLLYLLMFFLVVSGYLISTADGRGVEVFGLFSVPSVGEFIENQEDLSGEVHEIIAWSLIVLAGIHALAAFKHHFVDRDKILINMLYPGKK